MSEKIQFNTQPDQELFVLKAKKMDLDAGWLGHCFGGGDNAPLNIAGLMVILLAGSGVAVLFFQSSIPAMDYWKIIVPLLTLVMGYVFGKGTRNN
jgi:hypothetical protein